MSHRPADMLAVQPHILLKPQMPDMRWKVKEVCSNQAIWLHIIKPGLCCALTDLVVLLCLAAPVPPTPGSEALAILLFTDACLSCCGGVMMRCLRGKVMVSVMLSGSRYVHAAHEKIPSAGACGVWASQQVSMILQIQQRAAALARSSQALSFANTATLDGGLRTECLRGKVCWRCRGLVPCILALGRPDHAFSVLSGRSVCPSSCSCCCCCALFFAKMKH